MYGVSKISSEQNIMLTTFPGAQYSAQSLAEHLDVFAKAGIVVDISYGFIDPRIRMGEK